MAGDRGDGGRECSLHPHIAGHTRCIQRSWPRCGRARASAVRVGRQPARRACHRRLPGCSAGRRDGLRTDERKWLLRWHGVRPSRRLARACCVYRHGSMGSEHLARIGVQRTMRRARDMWSLNPNAHVIGLTLALLSSPACTKSTAGPRDLATDIGIGRDADTRDASSPDREAGNRDATAPDADAGAARDGGMVFFDTGAWVDAQIYDAGGDLPVGYSTECQRMTTEGCVSALSPCSGRGEGARVETLVHEGQIICRCSGWPLFYWEAGNGYRQRCDGTFPNRCREEVPVEAACDEGLVCTGGFSGSFELIRGSCWRPCADPSGTQECAELTAQDCCRPVDGGLRACLDPDFAEGCLYPQLPAVACGGPGRKPWCP